jgi:cytoskeleton protein RodZ
VASSSVDDVGGRLREARERLGLTLEEVERTTRIRIHHLEAIERGELDSLPSPVQARGFLRNYAEFLGLEPGDVMLQYAEGLHKRKTRTRASVAPAAQESPRLGRLQPLRWLSADMLVAALVTVVVIAVLIWGGGRVMAAMRQSSENSQPASAFLIPSQTPSPIPTLSPSLASELSTASPTPANAALTPGTLTLLGPVGQVDLRLVVEKRTWLRVVVDGTEAFSGRAAPGQALPDYIGQVVEVWTGNAGGLRVVYNGQDQGLLGELGEVVIRLWTTQGVLTPTPTQTPTATETPRVSPTPKVSPTPPPIRLPTTTPEVSG